MGTNRWLQPTHGSYPVGGLESTILAHYFAIGDPQARRFSSLFVLYEESPNSTHNEENLLDGGSEPFLPFLLCTCTVLGAFQYFAVGNLPTA